MAEEHRGQKGGSVVSTTEIITNLHALDSKISILAQRMKVLEDNQKILSQTLLKVRRGEDSSDKILNEIAQLKLMLEEVHPTKVVTYDKLYKLVDERVKQLIKR